MAVTARAPVTDLFLGFSWIRRLVASSPSRFAWDAFLISNMFSGAGWQVYTSSDVGCYFCHRAVVVYWWLFRILWSGPLTLLLEVFDKFSRGFLVLEWRWLLVPGLDRVLKLLSHLK
ncbi:hypothetical protein F2Q68_00011798 [Brassica cretica]|uniref:Uncharacterized protein n=1 Tax=Brassica cretica TaxID=69181 RepID=A0A8S9KZM5_BRACR|nr:hypothetical protein F2Q68_00011798 [Brassica cretica]